MPRFVFCLPAWCSLCPVACQHAGKSVFQHTGKLRVKIISIACQIDLTIVWKIDVTLMRCLKTWNVVFVKLYCSISLENACQIALIVMVCQHAGKLRVKIKICSVVALCWLQVRCG